jgi:RNA polymerase-binding protein DksA
MSSLLKPEDLEAYRSVLEGLRARLKGDLQQMTDHTLNGHSRDGSGNLSSVPLHLADLGSENFDQEFTLGLIENEQETLDQIGSALARIDGGTFGLCQACGEGIARARLQALPYATHCINCARRLESSK